MDIMRFFLIILLAAGSMVIGLLFGFFLPRGDVSFVTEPLAQIVEREQIVVEKKMEAPRSPAPVQIQQKPKQEPKADLRFSQLDSTKRALSEAAFTPWLTPKEASDNWHRWAGKRIPILSQRRSSDSISRDIWVDNDFSTGFCMLTCLSYESLLRVHQEKLKIKDELISCTQYLTPQGEKRYWALWLPAKKAPQVKKKMSELGVIPASLLLPSP